MAARQRAGSSRTSPACPTRSRDACGAGGRSDRLAVRGGRQSAQARPTRSPTTSSVPAAISARATAAPSPTGPGASLSSAAAARMVDARARGREPTAAPSGRCLLLLEGWTLAGVAQSFSRRAIRARAAGRRRAGRVARGRGAYARPSGNAGGGAGRGAGLDLPLLAARFGRESRGRDGGDGGARAARSSGQYC